MRKDCPRARNSFSGMMESSSPATGEGMVDMYMLTAGDSGRRGELQTVGVVMPPEAKEIEVPTSTNFDCSKWIEAKLRSLSTTVGKWLFRDGKPVDLEAESGPNVLENYVMLNN